MTIPDWLRDAEDGVYGSLDALEGSIKDGQEEAAWNRLAAHNALNLEKIRLWLHSDSYRERYPEPTPPARCYLCGNVSLPGVGCGCRH